MTILYILLAVAMMAGYYFMVTRVLNIKTKVTELSFKTPAKSMNDNITYFTVPKRKLMIWNILGSLSPAMIIGMVGASLWGPLVLVGIPIFSLVIIGMTEYFYSLAIFNNDGRDPKFVFAKIFGKGGSWLLNLLQSLLFIGIAGAMLYFPLVEITKSFGLESPIIFVSLAGIVPLITILVFRFAKKDMVAFSVYANFGIAFVTVAALIGFMIKPELWHGLTTYAGEVTNTDSANSWLGIFAIAGISILSARQVFFNQSIIRNVEEKKEMPEIIAWRRIAITAFLMIWAIISLAIFGSDAKIIGEVTAETANIFDNIIIVLKVVFGNEMFANIALGIISLSVLWSIEQESAVVRRMVLRWFKASPSDSKVQIKAGILQALFLSGIAAGIFFLEIESQFWGWLAVLSLVVVMFYAVITMVHAGWKFGKIWAIIPAVLLGTASMAATSIIINMIPNLDIDANIKVYASLGVAVFVILLVIDRSNKLGRSTSFSMDESRY